MFSGTINYKKIILYILLLIVMFFLWSKWQTQTELNKAKNNKAHQMVASVEKNINGHSFNSDTAKTAKTAKKQEKEVFTPKVGGVRTLPIKPSQQIGQNNKQLVRVSTDTFNASINLNNGSIQMLSLPAYPVSLKDKSPFLLFGDNQQLNDNEQSGLVDKDSNPIKVYYQAPQRSYRLSKNQKDMSVVLKGKTSNGLDVTKTYTFSRNSYVINVAYTIINKSNKTKSVSFYGQLVNQPSLQKGNLISNRSYKGASMSSVKKSYREITYKWLNENQLSQQTKAGWVAQQQQYFLGAWVPNPNETNSYYSNTKFVTGSNGKAANIYTVGFITPQTTIEKGQQVILKAKLFAGPQIAKRLKKVAPGLERAIDYGWLWMLSKLLFWLMSAIYSFVKNWGVSIVLVTFVIKLCFYKLSEHSYKSMAKMKKLAPRIADLKSRYGDDKKALGKATMDMYRSEKVNPAGGCLPMVIQIPFFFALYYVLVDTVQLRQAPFIFWIHDLSIMDPYYVLPLLMSGSMFLQQKLSPPPPDPAQAKAMMFLPVVFFFMFFRMPAGLTLYWLTNNVLTLAQQWYVMRKFDSTMPSFRKKKKALNKK